MFKNKQQSIMFRSTIFLLSLILVLGSCSTSKRSTKRDSDTTRKYSESSHKRKKSSSRTKSKNVRHSTVSKDVKLRTDLVKTAKRYRGIKYVYGGKTPKGFDCSGFITYVMQQNGVDLKGSSRMLAKKGIRKSKRQLKTGDLVFFGSGAKVSHIAMVVNNDDGLSVIHSTSSRGVVIDDISSSVYWKKKYLFGKSVL